MSKISAKLIAVGLLGAVLLPGCCAPCVVTGILPLIAGFLGITGITAAAA